MKFRILVFCCFWSFGWMFAGLVPVLLEQRVKKIVQPIPGQMGIAALHIESGQHVEVNGNVRFPMASTYKLPIALYCLSLVDKGLLHFDDSLSFTDEDLRRGESDFFSFTANRLSIPSTKQLTLRQVMQVMLEYSSNTATDKILKLIGGPDKVTAWVQGPCHCDQMRIDRTTMRMRADFSGVKLDNDYRCTVSRYNALYNQVNKRNYRRANSTFFDDPRDTTTPCAMVDLLARMYQGKLVSGESTHFLIDTMSNCHRFGKGRLVRLLPKHCKVLHKTGRLDGIVADVGVIELPRHKGHIALALYSNKSTTHEEKRDLAMARVARAVYDYFSA